MKKLLDHESRLAAAAGRIGVHPLDELARARVSCHYALQLPSAVGFTFVPARADYRHTVARWNRARGEIDGPTAPQGFTASLDPVAGAIVLRDGEHERDRVTLPGRTLDEAYAWLGGAIARLRGETGCVLTRPAHDLPDHPIAHGDPFPEVSPGATSELAAWLELADVVLASAAERLPGASVPCIWPHHFDTATLVDLDAREGGKSMGIGFSPGDASYTEPYFYVNVWPYPDPGTPLPELGSGGHWHTEGWTGAVLRGDALLRTDDRVQALDAWLVTAVDASRDLLR
jgi:hypothetical protein